jgi:hypothetical protein
MIARVLDKMLVLAELFDRGEQLGRRVGIVSRISIPELA